MANLNMLTAMFTRLAQYDSDLGGLPTVEAESDSIQKGLSVIFGVFAAVAVLVIITAAIDFANSGGDPEKIARGKKTIIFALIGLVICISAEVIVNTVLTRL